MIAVYVTFSLFKYPLTIHCAAWGTGVGLLLAYLLRALGVKDSKETQERQKEVRDWIDNIEAPSAKAAPWRQAMKYVVPLWYLFAIGPLCILGNSAFSFAGFPPVWSWQITWWMLGLVMMWALCFKAEMSTVTDKQIERAEQESNIVVEEVIEQATSK